MRLHNKQFVMLSGLPRTGSTLLSAILSQNPNIHAEGNSALCTLMWDLQVSFQGSALEQIKANNRERTQDSIISELPYLYYKDVTSNIILDKCRGWTFPENVEMIDRYISKDIKILVMHRSIKDIVKSFVRLRVENNITGDLLADLLTPGKGPILTSFSGILNGRKKYKDIFLDIYYNNLLDDFENTINRIYKFCNWEPFSHDPFNIEQKHKENDDFYGLKGFHDIRSKLSRRENIIILPKEVEHYCDMLDNMIKAAIEE